MPDLKIAFKDAVIEVQASLITKKVTILLDCRAYKGSMTPSEFAAFIYPLLNQKAEELEQTNGPDAAKTT